MTAAALVQFDPELVRDREVRFVSLALNGASVSQIESWTVGSAGERAWDLVGLVVEDWGGGMAMLSRPRLSPNVRGTKDITWMDLRGALAEAYQAGALSRRRQKEGESGDLVLIRREAAEYAEKNHRAVGE